MEDVDELLTLPADTLNLLRDFSAETDARVQEFESLKKRSEEAFKDGAAPLSMDLFGEDWNASQFWYTDDTAQQLALKLLDGVDENSAIAVVSAPSVYVQLRNIVNEQSSPAKPSICLLEYDQRFEVFGSDFVTYDFHHPLRLPAELEGKFDRIICDPPFLSGDCQAKTAQTVRYLARAWKPRTRSGVGVKFISCTGERMEAVVTELYRAIDVKTTTFEPEHSKGLGNEFWCYANFECEEWKWR